MNNQESLSKEQKSSIVYLLASKAMERLAFFMVVAVLMQYLLNAYGLETQTADMYYSMYFGMIVFGTLFSGWLGDGKDRTGVVKIGFVLMICMYLLFAFLPDANTLTLVALLIMGLGNGMIAPNLIVFLGNIYNEKEREIKGLSGFVWFSVTSSIGALLAPVLANVLKEGLGYTTVFVASFVFGLLSFLLFQKFKGIYRQMDLVAEQKEDATSASTKKLNTLILVSVLSIGVLIRFALSQKDLTLAFAMGDYLNNALEYRSFIDGFAPYLSLLFLLVFAGLVWRIKQLNWKKIFNFILAGIGVCLLAYVLVIGYEPLSGLMGGEQVFTNAFVLIMMAETLLSSVLFYAVYRSSPMKHKGLFQGVSYLVLAVSNSLLFVGSLMYQNSGMLGAFLVLAIVLVVSGVLMFGVKRRVVKN